ncbi:MAG: helix-turn-helix transcriptional regulator [Lachnospiraceae bacterium]|nr:helix-turn-helix transcriptional regulator [Lachnospiraceae bacterium]
MNTKQRIMDEALTLFAEKGYGNVFVAQIAEAVGIKAPSLYKHYKSKQDIFNAILDEMKQRYDAQAEALNMNGNDATADAQMFAGISEDALVQMGIGLFSYFLHDEYAGRFRKMLTMEQFRNPELSQLYTQQYVDGPLSYQAMMFTILTGEAILAGDDVNVMAIQFYAPIYMLLTLCDRHPEREVEALRLLEQHIRQFNRNYQV